MICERCFGSGLVRASIYVPPVLCPDCGGHGVVHCCDGDRATPEPRVEEKPA